MTESVFFGRNLSKKADFAKFAPIFKSADEHKKTNKVKQKTFFAIIVCVTAAVCDIFVCDIIIKTAEEIYSGQRRNRKRNALL
jgi:hypothetical protein